MQGPVNDERNRQSPSWAVLAVMTLAIAVGFIDRQVINLLIQPIKHDFGLSDLEVSLLQGSAFIVAYLLASPVFGVWADISNRRNILLGCLVVWSGFTVLCGFATGFTSLFIARALVGMAEAGLTPSAFSILSDSFDEKRLSRAMSIYNIGPYVGSGMALLVGGAVLHEAEGWNLADVPLLAGVRPWQMTMMVVGVVGLICAIPLMAIREPVRRGVPKEEEEVGKRRIPVAEAIAIMCSRARFYVGYFGGMALSIIPLYAFPAWIPTLATRQYHVPLSEVGLHYGIVTIAAGTCGVLTGPGWVAILQRRLGVRDGNIRIGIFTNLAVLVTCVLLAYRPSYMALLAIAGTACFFYSMTAPLAATSAQIVTPNRMRGLVTAIYLVIAGAMGLALSPVLVAVLTDKVFRDEVRVGDSVAIVCGVATLGAAAMFAWCLRGYHGLLDKPITIEVKLPS